MTTVFHRAACGAVLVLAALGLARAARFQFQEKEEALLAASRAQLQKLGITRDEAKKKYPTPEIHMVSSDCLLPGTTGDVVVKGKFAPGTKFVFENDNINVTKEGLTSTEYRATVQVAAGTGPQPVPVWAMSNVSGIVARQSNGFRIGGRFEWSIEAANGWKIVAAAPAGRACGGPANGDDQYTMSFYQKGANTPFEKRRASLDYSPYDAPNYRFDVSADDGAASAGLEDMTALMQKLADPNLSDAQRDQLMKRVEAAQEQAQKNLAKMADPDYAKQLEAKRQQFGCKEVDLAVEGSSFTGELRCAPAVGEHIAVTGTLKLLGK
jgi:hypothetical protein